MRQTVIRSGWHVHKSETRENIKFVKKLRHRTVCNYSLCQWMVDIATKNNNIKNHNHHKHQGLDPLIRSVSKVTTALSNVSSVFQLFSFLVVCRLKIFEIVPNFIITITIITTSSSPSSRNLATGPYPIPKSAIQCYVSLFPLSLSFLKTILQLLTSSSSSSPTFLQ